MPAAPAASPAADVKERILRAAEEQFALRGFEGASVREIGAAAGVTAAMINYYYRGKAELYDAAVGRAMQGLLERLSGAFLGSGEPGPALAGAYFDFLAGERRLQRILLWEVLQGGDGVRRFARRYLVPLRLLLRARVPLADPDELFQRAVSLFGAVAGYFIYAPVLKELLGEDPASKEGLARRRRHVLELASKLSRI